MNRRITVDEETLIKSLRETMHRSIQNQRYTDAIFFADKILHLITSRQEGDFVTAVYDLANCYILSK